MKVTTMRLPDEMIELLDRYAGEHIEGRSGIVRQAVTEYFQRHPLPRVRKARRAA